MNDTVLKPGATREVLIVPVPKPGDDIVEEICNLHWHSLSRDELVDVAWTYYYFSVQFRENFAVACGIFPDDEQLQELDRGERDTDNLSPYPGVVAAGERVNHDEFMRRALQLTPIDDTRRRRLENVGAVYLDKVRSVDNWTKATSLASYEDGGLEKVFRSMLEARYWDDPLLQAFEHFLKKHIEFDSDVEKGHGGLCRHLPPNEQVSELWTAFKESLVRVVPTLQEAGQTPANISISISGQQVVPGLIERSVHSNSADSEAR